MTMHTAGFVDDAAEWRARVAAEVAARYGVPVAPEVVAHVPTGTSGFPGVMWDGWQLVYTTPALTWQAAREARFRSHSRIVRMTSGPDPAREKRKAEVARLHALRWSDAQIMAELQVSLSTVRNDRYALGLPSNGHLAHLELVEARVARVLDLHRREFSVAVIGAQEGMKEDLVKELLRKKLGVSFRRPKAPPKPKVERVKAEKRVDAKAAALARKEARRAQVKALAEAGRSQTEIAATLGVCRRTVSFDVAATESATLARAGKYAPRREKVAAVDARRLAVLAALQTGLGCKAVASDLGYSRTTVREDKRALIASGAFVPSAVTGAVAGPEAARQAQVKAMALDGLSQSEIAEALGVCRRTVRRDVAATGSGAQLVKHAPRRAKVAAVDARRMAVLAALKTGLGCNAVARALNIPKTTVADDRRALIASGAFVPVAGGVE